MTARDYALLRIDAEDLPGWRAGSARRRRVEEPKDPRDLALGEQIAIGVVKNLLLLQLLIEHYAGRKLSTVDALVQKILAVALYQMRFLTRVPASAAVDQAVEQARRFGRTSAAGFVNAVLRNVARQPELKLPAIDGDTVEYAQMVLSHPEEVTRRLIDLAGNKRAIEICEHDNREPPTIVRLGSGVSLEQLAAEGVELIPHERLGLAVVSNARRPVLADWAQRGLAQVQDPTSAAVVERARIEAGQLILDRCAGLGTKTLQMRELCGAAGCIHAIDPNGKRLDSLGRLARDRRFENVFVHRTAMIGEIGDVLPRQFGRVLVDVPCSNSGVMARRPETRYRQSGSAVASLGKLQREILNDTVGVVGVGGLLIYSTCSIWPVENEEMVGWLLAEHPEFSLVEQAGTLPSSDAEPAHYHDGGFVAVFRRER